LQEIYNTNLPIDSNTRLLYSQDQTIGQDWQYQFAAKPQKLPGNAGKATYAFALWIGPPHVDQRPKGTTQVWQVNSGFTLGLKKDGTAFVESDYRLDVWNIGRNEFLASPDVSAYGFTEERMQAKFDWVFLFRHVIKKAGFNAENQALRTGTTTTISRGKAQEYSDSMRGTKNGVEPGTVTYSYLYYNPDNLAGCMEDTINSLAGDLEWLTGVPLPITSKTQFTDELTIKNTGSRGPSGTFPLR
jgi:hypothetical protein